MEPASDLPAGRGLSLAGPRALVLPQRARRVLSNGLFIRTIHIVLPKSLGLFRSPKHSDSKL